MKHSILKFELALIGLVFLISCANNEVKTLSIDKTTSALTLGQTDSIIVTMTLSGDISKLPQTWSSSNTAVVTVKNGKIDALTAGSATITVQAGSKSATCQVTVSDQIKPVISHGDLVYYGDAYGTQKDSLLNNESHNFVIYLASPLVNSTNYFMGTNDRVMLELNTDTLQTISIPSGTYDMMTDLTRSKLLPFTLVPAYVYQNYPWGTWYFGVTNNDIITGNVVVLNTNNVYDISYNLIDYYGNQISGTFHGTLNYTNNAQASPAQKISTGLKSLNHSCLKRFN